MENKRGESMNKKNTDQLLNLINELVKLVGKNTDHINKLAEEIAELRKDKQRKVEQ